MKKAIRIYLDSSDISILSKDAGLDQNLALIKEKLLAWSDSGAVDFFYSSLHVAELAPTKAEYTNAAAARAKLLYQLCGKRTFISFLDVLEGEVRSLAGSEKAVKPWLTDGNWFPFELPDLLLSDGVALNMDFVADYVAKLDRAKRREIERNPKKRRQILEAVATLADKNKEVAIAEIMQSNSLNRSDAEVFRDYSLARIPREKMGRFIRNRLTDPTFLIQQCATNFEKMQFLFNWLRGPAESHRALLSDSVKAAERWRSHPDFDTVEPRLQRSFTEAGMAENCLKLMLQVSSGIVREKKLHLEAPSDIDAFINSAPGLYAFASIAIESSWTSFTVNPRSPKSSDTGDLWHAIYGPYVDIYRTDGFMAPIAKKYMKNAGTIVVGKLSELTRVVEDLLLHQASAHD